MVDLGRIQIELRRLSSPAGTMLGRVGVYEALKKQVKVFEDDKDFKKDLDKKKSKK
jgi:hypothetical protein